MTQFEVYKGDGSKLPEGGAQIPELPPASRERGKYLAEPELAEAVNLALAVGQPLLVTGEPGCGKTRLAWSVAEELGLGEPLQFYTRSSSRAQDLLYTFDAVLRFHDIQSKHPRAETPEPYIRFQALGRAIVEGARRVVLIDEIDKAPRDFPNDLLTELDRMWFDVHELDEAQRRKESAAPPIVIITSNSERQLPLPFLRRCVYHHIEFPPSDKLKRIIEERLGHLDLDPKLVEASVDQFSKIRAIPGLTKRPATSELLTWVTGLIARGFDGADLQRTALAQLPLWQALLKDRDDLRLLREAR